LNAESFLTGISASTEVLNAVCTPCLNACILRRSSFRFVPKSKKIKFQDAHTPTDLVVLLAPSTRVFSPRDAENETCEETIKHSRDVSGGPDDTRVPRTETETERAASSAVPSSRSNELARVRLSMGNDHCLHIRI